MIFLFNEKRKIYIYIIYIYIIYIIYISQINTLKIKNFLSLIVDKNIYFNARKLTSK